MSEKYKIIANKQQLKNIGISYEITGLIGVFKKEFSDGWLVIRVTVKLGEYEFTTHFDLPPEYLEKINKMKSKKQITKQLNKLKTLLEELNEEHNNLGQIDMLSSIGSDLRKKINIVKGKIKGLKWVLDEKDISNNN